MKTIKQTIFKIELSHPNQWSDIFFVEADNFDEALSIAKEVLNIIMKNGVLNL